MQISVLPFNLCQSAVAGHGGSHVVKKQRACQGVEVYVNGDVLLESIGLLLFLGLVSGCGISNH